MRFTAAPISGSSGELFGYGWRGEWAVPFNTLGLTPSTGRNISFNMAAYSSEFGNGTAGKARSQKTGA
jgi:hypothetical protein